MNLMADSEKNDNPFTKSKTEDSGGGMMRPMVLGCSLLLSMAFGTVGCHLNNRYVTHADLQNTMKAMRQDRADDMALFCAQPICAQRAPEWRQEAVISTEGYRRAADSLDSAIRSRAQWQQKLENLTREALTARTIKARAVAIAHACELDNGSLLETLKAIELCMAVASHNLANARTVGFKRSKVHHLGSESVPVRIFTQGRLEKTGNQLDLAIMGDGFFRVALFHREKRYTRAGSLTHNAEGMLVTTSGLAIEPSITIPPGAVVSIANDGTVTTTVGGQAPSVAGRISIVRFANPAGLSSGGKDLLSETAASGTAVEGTAGQKGFGEIRQGFLERSNVQIRQEVTQIIMLRQWSNGITRALEAIYDPRAARGERIGTADADTPEITILLENGPEKAEDPDKLVYVEMYPITTNLGDVGSRRFVKAGIVLSVTKRREEEVTKLVSEERNSGAVAIKNWLIKYFSGLKLSEVKGPKQHNRMCREIKDGLNQLLWPNKPPVVQEVLFHEFMVQ